MARKSGTTPGKADWCASASADHPDPHSGECGYVAAFARMRVKENDDLLVNPIPRVRELAPDIPPALDAICARALSREPDTRYATAGEFMEALESLGEQSPIAPPRTRCWKPLVMKPAGGRT